MNQFTSDCVTCRFWQSRIEEQRKRALKGDTYSYKREQKARRELKQHLAHGEHVFGTETNFAEQPKGEEVDHA